MDSLTGSHEQLPSAAVDALRRGNKIEAIKLVRLDRHLGLKEAKELVEIYVRSQPALHRQMEAAYAQAKASFVRWLFLIVAIIVIGVVLWSTRS